jgi:hypothetical protein
MNLKKLYFLIKTIKALYVIRTYAEEENCEAIFRRSGSEFIILRMHLYDSGNR